MGSHGPDGPHYLKSRVGFAFVWLSFITSAACSRPPRNLVIVTIDTVRADHIPIYGYGRATAPRFSALAARGWLFRRAFTQETNTLPSHASMMTGHYPFKHGAIDNGDALAADQVTLAEILHDAGWSTGAFVSGWPLIPEISGLDQGFDVYDADFAGIRRGGAESTRRAIDWWKKRNGDLRFLFLHLFDAHGPYDPDPSYRPLFANSDPGPIAERVPAYQRGGRWFRGARPLHVHELIDAYDAQIRYDDDQLGTLLDAIDLSATVLVVLSDHGETLDDHQPPFNHGTRVFDEQIRIPLVLCAPGLSPRAIDSIVETVDLVPTLLDLLHVTPPGATTFPGRNLLRLVDGDLGRPPLAFSSAHPARKQHTGRDYFQPLENHIHSARTESFKLIRTPKSEGDSFELYDLVRDPKEQHPQPLGNEQAVSRLREILMRYAGQAGPEWKARSPSPEEEKNLRSLGYVN